MREYFQELLEKSESRFWINNPSLRETELAIAEGAFACTTNPAYCSKLISSEKEYLVSVIDEEIKRNSDYDELAQAVYRVCGKRLMDLFMPVYNKSGGKAGFVTVQDDPRYDMDTKHTVENIQRNRELSLNYMAKIPVISGGIEAIEACVEMNVPICATEVFAISQARHIAEKYLQAAERTGNRPPIYITHISGIFDEYLKKTAGRLGIRIAPEVLDQAGIAVARKEYRLLCELGFEGRMLGGGARGVHHFTGIIGGPHITINWSTAQEILEGEYWVEKTVDLETSQAVIDELCDKLPDFRKAYEDDGLAVGEFADYGPVQLFRNSFLKGWYQLLALIADRKNALAI